MPRTKGTPKTGGRKKGTPNKKTSALTEALDQCQFDVVRKLTEIIPQLEPEKQADVLVSMLSYIYPKRKAVELTQEPQAPEPFVITFVKGKDGRPA